MSRIVDEPLFPRRTHADRRRCVRDLLLAHPEYSDRRVAFIAVVSRETVALMRSNLIKLGRIEDVPIRAGADGKTYRPRKGGGK